jgi:chromosome segregation ATPase
MPEASLSDLRARLVEKREHVAELEARRDELAEERAEAKRKYAEALVERGTLLDVDDLVNRFTLDELREKLDVDDAAESASLADTEPTIQSGDTPETASLSRGERERVAELESKLEDLPDRDSGLVARERERLKNELAEIRGGAST